MFKTPLSWKWQLLEPLILPSSRISGYKHKWHFKTKWHSHNTSWSGIRNRPETRGPFGSTWTERRLKRQGCGKQTKHLFKCQYDVNCPSSFLAVFGLELPPQSKMFIDIKKVTFTFVNVKTLRSYAVKFGCSDRLKVPGKFLRRPTEV